MKFRKYLTEEGTLILAGKNAENNEELIKQVEPFEYVLHTKKPGSPFVNIKGKATKKDIKQAAVFCARYSQAWKKAKIKRDVIVHVFKGKDIYKEKSMKTGTFGVKKFKQIKIKKEEIKEFIKKELKQKKSSFFSKNKKTKI